MLTNAHHQEESRRGSRLTLRLACELQVWRSVHWLGADDTELDSAILTWATTPIDHLRMRLQYTDAAGSSLLDVIADATSPFVAARQELTNMIVRPFADGPLSALPYHFVNQLDALMNNARTLIVSLAAQIWFWFEVQFAEWPYKLRNIVSPGGDDVEAIGQELYDAHDCCLDAHFSLKAMIVNTEHNPSTRVVGR